MTVTTEGHLSTFNSKPKDFQSIRKKNQKMTTDIVAEKFDRRINDELGTTVRILKETKSISWPQRTSLTRKSTHYTKAAHKDHFENHLTKILLY
jgi:hypothetical protein